MSHYNFISGISTDGDFNSLRTCGNARPISVIEIMKNAKADARKTKSDVMSKYFKTDEFGRYAFIFL